MVLENTRPKGKPIAGFLKMEKFNGSGILQRHMACIGVILNAKNWYIGMFNNKSAKVGAGAEYENGQLKQSGIYASGKIQEVMLKK